MAPPPPTSKPVFESEAPASNNLWIGNLSPEVSESELTALFEKYGPIDSITSYSARSYAFVYYKNIDDAKAAKEKLQGTNLCGNSIKIEFAKPARPCKSLWVAGLNQSVSKEELEEEFLKFGKIQEFKFLKDRNTAYVDYVRLEDATHALKSMNGKQLRGDQIRVDFLRSQPSRREPLPEFRDSREGQYPNRGIAPQEARWMAQDSLKVYSESIHAGSKRHLPSIGGRRGDGQPSKVLWVNYPPSVQIDEDQLHNAMILFGEIERIKTFEDRNYAFVQFRSVDEARLAKEGLQGKLFSNPRISIEYSNSEVAPSYGNRPGIEGPIPDVYSNDTPFHHGQNPQIFSSLGGPGPDVLLRPLGHQGSFESQGGHMSGPNWRRSSPMPGLLSSPSATINPPNRSASGAWDIFDASQLQRESKRSRVDNTLQVYDSSYPPRRTDDQGLVYDDSYGVRSSVDSHVSFEGRNRVSPLNAPLSTTGVGKRPPEPDYVWRGIIAKGGSPICRARCVPIGKGIEFPIPDVVNCTARTGLDMLTKHYADAIGFSIAFFLPDSEADFDSYTEFLRYLGARNRAGVAKFDDGTTLFLVPPSDFLTKVLKVTGPARLYGVVLEFPPTAPDTSSVHPETLQQHYVDPLHQATSLTAYSGMPQEGIALPMQYNRDGHEGGKPPLKMLGPSGSTSSMNNAVASQAGVTLTPELIATLASLLPANKLSVSESPSVPTTATALGPTLNSNPAPDKGFTQAWPQERNVQQQTGHIMQQFSSQAQYMPQLQAYQPISNPPQYPGQIVSGYNQVQDGFNWQQQGVVPSLSMASVIPPHGQISTSSHVGQHQHVMLQESLRGPGMTQGTDQTRFYGSTFLQQPANHVPVSNEVNGATVQLPHPPLPHSSGMNVNNQVQERSALQGGGVEKVETEEEKNRRYQSTLLFAVNLLNKVQQPSGAQTSTQGS